jgi:probable rRNA maturation factor
MPSAVRRICGPPTAAVSEAGVLEVEVLGVRSPAGVRGAGRAPGVGGEDGGAGIPGEQEVRELCERAAHARGVTEGHVAIEFVDAARIAQLNERHLGRRGPTDVLSFPIDGPEATAAGARGTRAGEPLAPRELGDVAICAEHTRDIAEAIVHGMLHLLGMDHERDGGEMLALQSQLLARGARR